MTKRSAQDLLEKYRTGRCTAEERRLVEAWFAELGEDAYPEEDLVNDAQQRAWSSMKPLLPVRRSLWKPLVAAAAVLVLLLAGLYGYHYRNSEDEKQTAAAGDGTTPIVPGGREAVLTLSDGSKISLDDAGEGNLAVQGNANVVKLENGQITYRENGQSAAGGLNVLQTPRGGQYTVTLSDGTKVWLNAESSITYPTAFTGKERRVSITGEVYFEVAHRADQPFYVVSEQQELKVLGTHFNVEAYGDDSETRTTLLEGSVRITPAGSGSPGAAAPQGTTLKPKQQAVISPGSKAVGVSAVNPDDVVAWKNGLFVFNNESMESVMRKIARWYDVQVVYEDSQPKEELFGGSVSRFDDVTTVLRMLEKTGDVRFQVKGRTIFIYAGQ
ncbi:FecR family protein [Parapedobacter lycopersici]|uniref:FecR family protein n=1 Tax=Parapedobacter lycopersici TaxID=1864939 RepID=UPI00214DBC15|nr:FecR domain-containing protein [Parapedobacter lycopersici]